MYTEPDFRRRGLATRIVREAVAWCRSAGFRSMRLHASRAGRRVYAKLGWERTWEYALRLAPGAPGGKSLTRRRGRAIR